MKLLKKVFVIFLTPLVFNLFNYWAAADASSLYAKADTTKTAPKSRILLEKDIPEEKEEESWFSKYKWWVVAGVVLIAGAAAAGGGGGGGGSDTPSEQPDDKGDYIVSW